MNERVAAEVALLQSHFPKAILHNSGRWVLIPEWKMPDIWSLPLVSICFQIPENYPGQKLYAFYVSPSDSTLKSGQPIQNAQPGVSDPPFGGTWLKFSWELETWQPKADPRQGSNLLNFVNTFRNRLEQGS